VTQRYWRIQGYDGSAHIFETKLEIGQITYDQLKQMLKTLTAQAALDYNEIVGAHAKRRTKIANDLLAIHREPASATFSCGTHTHFVASVVDDDGKMVRYPKLS
jgi:hypothetical protein